MLRPFHPRRAVPTRTTRPVPSLPAGRVLLRLLPVAGLLGWQLVVVQPAQARADALDPSFGRHGIATTDFGGTDFAGHLVVQADGKLVAAGYTITSLSSSQGYSALARYNPNGSLDQSFGSGGRVTNDLGGYYGARGLVVQADSKPVIAGTAPTGGAGGAHGFALARFNPDGSLDPTFGSGGKVITEFAGGSEDGAAALVVQGGKLVAGGTALNLQTLDLDFALARYNPDGSLDPSFGTGGKVTTDFPGGLANGSADQLNALAVQPDGKLVAVGSADTGENAFAVARYNPDGSLDQSFGSGGTVTTYLGGPDGDYGRGVAVQADGKPVATGLADNGAEPQCGLARYNLDGSLDQSFGTGGTVTTVSGQCGALVVQADGKLVAAGGARIGGQAAIGLTRYNPDGSLDQSFGTGGNVTAVGGVAGALAVQGSKLVTAGGSATAGGDFVLARFRTR
jgi:uncharacterized delta-60 repeat protein